MTTAPLPLWPPAPTARTTAALAILRHPSWRTRRKMKMRTMRTLMMTMMTINSFAPPLPQSAPPPARWSETCVLTRGFCSSVTSENPHMVVCSSNPHSLLSKVQLPWKGPQWCFGNRSVLCFLHFFFPYMFLVKVETQHSCDLCL